MSGFEERINANLVKSNRLFSSGAYDNDAAASLQWQQERLDRDRYALDILAARGEIEPEEYERAISGPYNDKNNFFTERRVFKSDIVQGAIDALSIGSYATAALTLGTMEDPLFQYKNFKAFPTPSAWWKHFKRRASYSDKKLGGNFWPGLAGDILLDPTTWLTLGMSTGTKVALSEGTQIGGKTLAKRSHLTLTDHGAEIYREAMRDFKPVIEKTLVEQNAKRIGKGLKPLQHLDDHVRLRLHDMVGDHMVSNYHELSRRISERHGRMWKYYGMFHNSAVTDAAQRV